MSTIQHINSVVNYNWPEYQRRFPAFDKPQIIPAETLRGMAPIYLHSAIDQDPTSMYMFISGDVTKGDCSREKACEFFYDLFFEKLGMNSSFVVNDGLSKEEAINQEVLPPSSNNQFQNFYDEQIAKLNAIRKQKERQRRINDLGFDPNNPDIIEIDDDGNVVGDGSNSRAVDTATTTAVGQPRKIFYCIDFHVPAGGMLGHDRNNGRLGRGGSGRNRLGRGPSGYLREEKTEVESLNEATYTNNLEQVRQEFSADPDLCWVADALIDTIEQNKRTFVTMDQIRNFIGNIVSFSSCGPAGNCPADYSHYHVDKDYFLIRNHTGKFTWIELRKSTGTVRLFMDRKADAVTRIMNQYYIVEQIKFYRKTIKPLLDAILRAIQNPTSSVPLEDDLNIREGSLEHLNSWNGDVFNVVIGPMSLLEFKTLLSHYPEKAREVFTARPIQYCQVDFGDVRSGSIIHKIAQGSYNFLMFTSPHSVYWPFHDEMGTRILGINTKFKKYLSHEGASANDVYAMFNKILNGANGSVFLPMMRMIQVKANSQHDLECKWANRRPLPLKEDELTEGEPEEEANESRDYEAEFDAMLSPELKEAKNTELNESFVNFCGRLIRG